MKKTLVASAITAGLLASPFAGAASADPTDVYPAALNGSGSDTTEVVMRALDAQIGALGNWDVAGPVPFDTNDTGAGCSFSGRIAGSGNGRTALGNSVTLGDGCWQFARSSSRSTSSTPGTVGGSYTASGPAVATLPITLAIDGLTYAFRAGSGTPRDLTLNQLRAIYDCNFTGSVDGRLMSSATIPNKPLLPADASGTRTDWVALMALPANSEVASDPGGALKPCIDDGPGDDPSTEFAEHNGNVLTNGRQIIVHSIAQYIAQGRAFSGDTRGLSLLGYINGNVPLQMYDNPGGTLTPAAGPTTPIIDGAYFRSVYNIVPASQIADPTIVSVFGTRSGGSDPAASGDVPTANSGAICTNDATVISAGFAPVC